MFTVKQIVWAKTKTYPWWPAEISKLPTSNQNFFKVTFLGETNHAYLQEKAIKNYLDNYQLFKKNTYKGLQNSILLADNEIQKRKYQRIQLNDKSKKCKNGLQKLKKIKKNKNKFNSKKLSSFKFQTISNQSLQEEGLQNTLNKISSQNSCCHLKALELHDNNPKGDCEISESPSMEQFVHQELDYPGQVDRGKIQRTEQKLFLFISEINSGINSNQKQCYQVIQSIDKNDFKPSQILQSKITNMITYIHKKLSSLESSSLKKQNFQRMDFINTKLKQSVHNYLFDCRYYDQFLNLMEKNILENPDKICKASKQQSITLQENKKPQKKLLKQK